MFVLYIKIINFFKKKKKKNDAYRKLSKEFNNGIRISVGQAVLELLIKTFWMFWSATLKNTWPNEMSMLFLSSLDKLLQDACIIFRKSVDNIEISQKHANFKLEVQYPLSN